MPHELKPCPSTSLTHPGLLRDFGSVLSTPHPLTTTTPKQQISHKVGRQTKPANSCGARRDRAHDLEVISRVLVRGWPRAAYRGGAPFQTILGTWGLMVLWLLCVALFLCGCGCCCAVGAVLWELCCWMFAVVAVLWVL